MLYLSGITITFFLVLLLAAKRDKSAADIILACWLILIGIHLFLYYLFLSGKIFEHPYLLGVQFPFPLMHGPFLYIYASALMNKTPGVRWKILLHFIPAIACFIYLIPFFLLTGDQKVEVFRNSGAGYENFMRVLVPSIMISGVVYVTLTLLLHQKYKRIIVEEFSNTEKIDLNWIRYLTFGIALIWIFVIAGVGDEWLYGVVVLFVLFIGFFGIRQTDVFSVQNHKPLAKEDVREFTEIAVSNPASETHSKLSNDLHENSVPVRKLNDVRSKYVRSGMSSDDLHRIHSQLNELMKAKKLFTNPELTLGETASCLDIHPNYLSQVINSVTGSNFYDYINAFRVEEFKQLVRDEKNQKFTLLSLAFECGFNSKTSFNRNFRKVTGLSPSEYMREIHVNVASMD